MGTVLVLWQRLDTVACAIPAFMAHSATTIIVRPTHAPMVYVCVGSAASIVRVTLVTTVAIVHRASIGVLRHLA